MYLVTVDDSKCTGCGECCEACPAQILALEGELCEVTGDPSECLGCESCVTLCPAEAITVQEL